MFERFKLNRQVDKIAKVVGVDLSKPLPAIDNLLLTILGRPLQLRQASNLWNNKYMLTDTAIIILIYVLLCLSELEYEEAINDLTPNSKFFDRFLKGASQLYNIQPDEVKRLYEDRYDTFYYDNYMPITDKLDDFAYHASCVLILDYNYNDFQTIAVSMAPVIRQLKNGAIIEEQAKSFILETTFVLDDILKVAMTPQ